jgi:hypothetical protein
MVVAHKGQGLSTTGYQAFIYVVCTARYRKVARGFFVVKELVFSPQDFPIVALEFI